MPDTLSAAMHQNVSELHQSLANSVVQMSQVAQRVAKSRATKAAQQDKLTPMTDGTDYADAYNAITGERFLSDTYQQINEQADKITSENYGDPDTAARKFQVVSKTIAANISKNYPQYSGPGELYLQRAGLNIKHTTLAQHTKVLIQDHSNDVSNITSQLRNALAKQTRGYYTQHATTAESMLDGAAVSSLMQTLHNSLQVRDPSTGQLITSEEDQQKLMEGITHEANYQKLLMGVKNIQFTGKESVHGNPAVLDSILNGDSIDLQDSRTPKIDGSTLSPQERSQALSIYSAKASQNFREHFQQPVKQWNAVGTTMEALQSKMSSGVNLTLKELAAARNQIQNAEHLDPTDQGLRQAKNNKMLDDMHSQSDAILGYDSGALQNMINSTQDQHVKGIYLKVKAYKDKLTQSDIYAAYSQHLTVSKGVESEDDFSNFMNLMQAGNLSADTDLVTRVTEGIDKFANSHGAVFTGITAAQKKAFDSGSSDEQQQILQSYKAVVPYSKQGLAFNYLTAHMAGVQIGGFKNASDIMGARANLKSLRKLAYDTGYIDKDSPPLYTPTDALQKIMSTQVGSGSTAAMVDIHKSLEALTLDRLAKNGGDFDAALKQANAILTSQIGVSDGGIMFKKNPMDPSGETTSTGLTGVQLDKNYEHYITNINMATLGDNIVREDLVNYKLVPTGTGKGYYMTKRLSDAGGNDVRLLNKNGTPHIVPNSAILYSTEEAPSYPIVNLGHTGNRHDNDMVDMVNSDAANFGGK